MSCSNPVTSLVEKPRSLSMGFFSVALLKAWHCCSYPLQQASALPTVVSGQVSFSSSEAALLFVSTKNRFPVHEQRIRCVLSANQICQTWLRACAEWREVREPRTSGVGPSQRSRFLVLTGRSAASGDENGKVPLIVKNLPHSSWQLRQSMKS